MEERLLSPMRTYVMSALLVGVASVGCYSPSLQPCEIACANRQCPDGLVCNTQGICALTDTATCDEVPIDAPNGDSGGTRVTIEVRDRAGAPLANVVVVFADAAGNQVAEMPTGANGLATVDMLPGGSATVIRTINRVAGGSDLNVATYLDLWPDAHVISQAETDPATRTVTVDFAPPVGLSFFGVYASCATGVLSSASPITVRIPTRCTTFDLIVTGAASSTQPPVQAAVLTAQSLGNITVPNVEWRPVRTVSGTWTGMPANANERAYSTVGWASPDRPAPQNPPPVTLVGAAGSVGPIVFPVGAGITSVLSVTTLDSMSRVSRQLVIDRYAAVAPDVNRNYSGDLVQWIGDPVIDLSTRTLTWPFTIPTGTAPVAPSFFAAEIVYSRGTMPGVIWRLIGASSRIVTTGTTQHLTYPDVPGMRPFEPDAANDIIVKDNLTLYQTEPLAVRDVRQILEPAGPDIDYFKISALRHLTISVAP